jgi:hypothetical protein
VLDDIEHLADAAEFVARLLASSPGVSVLLTSRVTSGLGGSPLAIELAASWFRVLTVGQIEGEVEAGLDILSATHADRPPRHRSVRTLIEQAWERLEPREQAAMRRLAVFRGGFDLAAARRARRSTCSATSLATRERRMKRDPLRLRSRAVAR